MGLYDDIISSKELDMGRMFSVTTALVKENWDKKHPGMIKIEFFLGTEGKNLSGWVPVAAPYAGTDYGYFALPEIGDEVVVAFNMGDRNCPIVIGSLWSKANPIPKETANKENTVKRMKTKGGCEITFNEKSGEEFIEIKTPKELQVMIDDKKEAISIGDKSGENGIVIDGKNGTVTLKAKKKIELNAGGSSVLTLDGTGKEIKTKAAKVTLEAGQAILVKGQDTQVTGSMVTVKGQSTVKVQSSGILEMKGSLAKIN